jgi:hypothetical protein
MCMSSTGTNNSVSKFEPPGWTTDTPHNWQDYVNRGGEIADTYATNPHLIYGNDGQPMVAQMSQLQNAAANGSYGQASAVPTVQNQQTQLNANDLLNGFMYNGGVNTQGGLGANPYAGSNPYMQNDGSNAYSTAANPYMGDNPYLQSVIDKTNQDTTNQFMRGTAAQTDSAAARSGAFGGSAYNELQSLNAGQLAQQLAGNESNIRMGNYNQSAQLGENAINRATQSREAQLGRGMEALQGNQSLAENALNRNWQGQESAFGRGLQALGINNQTQQLGNQLWQSVMGAGDLQQQTQQNNINAAMNLFNANVQQPISAEDLYGSILQRASGQGGTNTVSTPGQSPLTGLLGGGLAAYGMMH